MKPTYDIYQQYEDCIRRLVWKYVKKSSFEFDELFSEANQGFLHAVDTYNPNKASFHTHLYWTVNGKLRNYCNNHLNQSTKEVELNEFKLITNHNPESTCIFNNLIENLSKETQEVVQTIFNTPLEMIELVRKMSASRQGHMYVYKSNVTRYFKDLGWKKKKILKAYSEIKAIL